MTTTHPSPQDPQHAAPHGAAGQPEELIHVPKGRSRMQFVILVGLLIVMLVTFVVSGSIVSMFSRSRARGGAFATWRHPSEGTVEIGATEFFTLKEHLTDMRGRQADVEDLEVLRLAIVDRLAQDAGIEISDAELAQEISRVAEQLGGASNYLAWTRQMRGGTSAFESTLRSAMRAQRYEKLLLWVSAEPTPAEVEAAWHEDHQELAFELIQQPVLALREEARAALPADAELEIWYAALPDAQKNAFKTQTKWQADVAGVPLVIADGEPAPTFDASALLAKYPAPAETDAEQEARAYFDNYRYIRFTRPAPPLESGESGESGDPENQGAPPPPPSPFYEFDEVAERARLEAPIHAALGRWLADLAAREAAGTVVDFAAESQSLGLAFAPADQALAAEEWRSRVPLGGMYLINQLSMLAPGKVTSRAVIDPNGFLVPRLVARLEPALPPLADVREKVAEKWVDEEAGKRALAKLDALRARFLPLDASGDPGTEGAAGTASATAEAFAAAAAEAGLAVLRRDWQDKSGERPTGPAAEDPAQQFVASSGALNALEVDEVAAASLDATKTHAYLARQAGKRPVELSRMGPGDYTSYLQRPAMMAMFSAAEAGPFSQSALEARYELRMASSSGEE